MRCIKKVPQIKTDKNFMENQEVFCCPLCGFEYIHPYEIEKWKDNSERDEISFSVKNQCEGCFKEYDIFFRFYKDNILITYENIKEKGPDSET